MSNKHLDNILHRFLFDLFHIMDFELNVMEFKPKLKGKKL